jgi:hypothetical protein
MLHARPSIDWCAGSRQQRSHATLLLLSLGSTLVRNQLQLRDGSTCTRRPQEGGGAQGQPLQRQK